MTLNLNYKTLKFHEQVKCRNLSLGLTTKAKGLKGVGQEECEKENSHSQVNSPFGSSSPGGLSNL